MFEALIEERRKRGWSQAELARRAGMDQTVINGIERGRRPVTLRTLERLAEALEVPVFYLVHELEEERKGAQHDD